MSAEDEEFTFPEPSEDFVPAVFARSMEQAEMFCELLNDHDIPATVGELSGDEEAGVTRGGRSMAHGVPVLVPEALLDEAGEVIAEREDAEGQFDLGAEELEDEDEEDDEFEELEEEFEPGPGSDDDDYLVDLDDLDEEEQEDEQDEEEEDL